MSAEAKITAWANIGSDGTVYSVSTTRDQHHDSAMCLAAELDRLRAEVEGLRAAGALLSNCAFNLAQRDPGEFTDRDAKALDNTRKAWDAAIRSLSGPKGQGSGGA